MPKHRISGVEPEGIARQLGIQKGASLVSIDGKPVLDVVDYRYRLATQRLCARFVQPDGQELLAEIEKEYDEDLGLTFAQPLMSGKRQCANRCVFCFVDQLPEGVRASLRFKDDDWRLSFLHGNFVSFTNVGDEEMRRIVAQRVSPLHISVHTMDATLRAKMLGNTRAGRIRSQLDALASGNIAFYAQIVVCPGWNDGDALSDTLRELDKYRPHLKGIAVVPVGLTRYRAGLPGIRPVSAADARDVLARIRALSPNRLEPLARAADEFYLLAGQPIPCAAAYGDFAQMEDGVGMLRCFMDDFTKACKALRPERTGRRVLSVATGEASYPFIRDLCAKAEQSMKNLTVHVYPIRNDFFGGGVNVTGLLTGRCLRKGLAGKRLGERLLLAGSMLRSGEAVFLDDSTPEELEEALHIKVQMVPVAGSLLFNALRTECA